MKAHLLYRDRDFDPAAELAAQSEDLVSDLELRTLIGAMAGRDEFLADVCLRVVLSPLTDLDAIRYRQAVLQDFLNQPDLLNDLYRVATQALSRRKKLWGYSWSFRRPESILSGAREALEMYVGQLKALRDIADLCRPAVRSEGVIKLFESLQEDLSDDYLDSVAGHLKRFRFPDGVLLSAELGKDNSGDGYVLRVPERDKPGWKERLGMAPRTVYSFAIAPRDLAGAQALEDLRARGLNQVANAAAQSADHITDYFTMLRAELGFYVGCVNLAQQLSRRGHPTCTPEVETAQAHALTFQDLRDTALALQTDRSVIGNDSDADGRSLIVITGANSGGKSTFLRSLGLAQLMAQAGMFVTASSYRFSPVTGIFTHFLREEDRTMTKGRLEEELYRMAETAKNIVAGALVLFNESFHSTNEREGSEIARQIVGALRDTGNRVAFVSHQYDFANSFLAEEATAVVFLRADMGLDGKPDYRLRAGVPLSTAYGPGLYRKIFAGEQA